MEAWLYVPHTSKVAVYHCSVSVQTHIIHVVARRVLGHMLQQLCKHPLVDWNVSNINATAKKQQILKHGFFTRVFNPAARRICIIRKYVWNALTISHEPLKCLYRSQWNWWLLSNQLILECKKMLRKFLRINSTVNQKTQSRSTQLDTVNMFVFGPMPIWYITKYG